MTQNKKHEQTLESAQYGLEISFNLPQKKLIRTDYFPEFPRAICTRLDLSTELQTAEPTETREITFITTSRLIYSLIWIITSGDYVNSYK